MKAKGIRVYLTPEDLESDAQILAKVRRKEGTLSDTAEWLDGPRFCEWLQGEMGERQLHVRLSANSVRRYTEAKRGGALSVWVVDRILTELGLHLREVPDDAWLAKRPKRPVGRA